MAERSISRITTYIPVTGGNDQLTPENGQFYVRVKAMNIAKKQTHVRKFAEIDPKKLLKEITEPSTQADIRKLLEEHVVEVKNFVVNDIATPEDEKAGKKGIINGEEKELRAGDEYTRPMLVADMFEFGEFELVVEIFMHMIGSSQLRKNVKLKSDAEGNLLPPTTGEDREDEEKNSESQSGSTVTH